MMALLIAVGCTFQLHSLNDAGGAVRETVIKGRKLEMWQQRSAERSVIIHAGSIFGTCCLVLLRLDFGVFVMAMTGGSGWSNHFHPYAAFTKVQMGSLVGKEL